MKHKRRHNEENTHACSVAGCEELFPTSTALKKHLLQSHERLPLDADGTYIIMESADE